MQDRHIDIPHSRLMTSGSAAQIAFVRTLLTSLLCIGLFITLAQQAFAHDDAWFDAREHPHGGQMRMAGPYHVELIAKAGELTIHVTNHADQAIPTQGGSALATVLSGGQQSIVQLSPSGANRMHGSGNFPLDEALTVLLSITLPGQDSQQARFTPFQGGNDVDAHHNHGHSHDHGHHH